MHRSINHETKEYSAKQASSAHSHSMAVQSSMIITKHNTTMHDLLLFDNGKKQHSAEYSTFDGNTSIGYYIQNLQTCCHTIVTTNACHFREFTSLFNKYKLHKIPLSMVCHICNHPIHMYTWKLH